MLAPSASRSRAGGRVEIGVERLTQPTAESLWEDIARRLRETISETTYETWFAYAEPASLHGGVLNVSVPNDFTRDWIESHFGSIVHLAARESLGRDVAVSFAVSERALPQN